jgi:polyhydroxybutyrate depolymerase
MKRNKVLKMTGIVFLGLLVIVAALYLIYVYVPVADEPVLTSRPQQNTIMSRSFISYHPSVIKPKPALIIVLHGTNIDGAKIREWTGYEFDEMADKYGFLVAYPDGYDHDWNDCRKGLFSKTKRENVDDVGFIKAIINSYRAKFDIDKVYLFGYSSGGMMAFRIGMQEPSLIAGIATICSALPTSETNNCTLPRKMPRMMLVNGTGDPICPVNGGELNLFGKKRGHVISVQETAKLFANSNIAPVKTPLPHLNTEDRTSVDRYAWSADVVLFIVNNGGHVVPQPVARFPRIMGRVTADLNAPEEAVAFFGLKQ